MKEIFFFTAVLAGTVYLTTTNLTSDSNRAAAGVICEEGGNDCRSMTFVERMVGY